MTAPPNLYVAYATLPYSFHKDTHLALHGSRVSKGPHATNLRTAFKFMYPAHEMTIRGVAARAEPITLEEAYARQAKRFKGERNGLLVTVRAPDLPGHLRRSAVAWKPGVPNTIPLGEYEGDILTFDFMPGWSLLKTSGTKKKSSSRRDELGIWFAIWDIGEFTDSPSRAPSSTNSRARDGDGEGDLSSDEDLPPLLDPSSDDDSYGLEPIDAQFHDMPALVSPPDELGRSGEGGGSAKTKKKNASKRRVKKAKRAAAAEAQAANEQQHNSSSSEDYSEQM